MTVQHIVQGAGAPTSAPPSLTAHYTDTESGDQYMAKYSRISPSWSTARHCGSSTSCAWR